MGRKKIKTEGAPFHIVNFSGGKDSTAMLLMMLEKNMQIDEIVFCNTGVEHPETIAHVEQIKKDIDRKITTLEPKHSYDYLCTQVECADGSKGYGHPTNRIRWCTGQLKIALTNSYFKAKKNPLVLHLGIAADEEHRTVRHDACRHERRFPLVEWGITEQEALDYCYKKGYTWGGLYDNLSRVSCWCCPLMKMKDLCFIYQKRPKLWAKIRDLDSRAKNNFKEFYSMDDLELIFDGEYIKFPAIQKAWGIGDKRLRALFKFFAPEYRHIGKTKSKWYRVSDLESLKNKIDSVYTLEQTRKYLGITRHQLEYAVSSNRLKKQYAVGVGPFFYKEDLDNYKVKKKTSKNLKRS